MYARGDPIRELGDWALGEFSRLLFLFNTRDLLGSWESAMSLEVMMLSCCGGVLDMAVSGVCIDVSESSLIRLSFIF